MMSYDFQTHTHGKWILAGEHAVLRGHPALVFPIPKKTLTLTYDRSTEALHVSCEGEATQAIIWQTLQEGMRLLNVSLNDITGQIEIQNRIPVGSGMGASAALCVAIARWFVFLDLLPEGALLQFSKKLEHVFHGKSSGVDIAGVSSVSGTYFQSGEQKPLLSAWQPKWYLSFCGEVGFTSQCIQQVQRLWQEDENRARLIDQQMNQSVQMACTALQTMTDDSENLLAESIELAANCFLQWGLISSQLQAHMHHLRAHGAIATKPTGSGGGGYVVSLWKDAPPQDFPLMAI